MKYVKFFALNLLTIMPLAFGTHFDFQVDQLGGFIKRATLDLDLGVHHLAHHNYYLNAIDAFDLSPTRYAMAQIIVDSIQTSVIDFTIFEGDQCSDKSKWLPIFTQELILNKGVCESTSFEGYWFTFRKH